MEASPKQGRRGLRGLKKSKIAAIVVGLLVLVVGIASVVLVLGRTSTASTINTAKYQAVFFTNGQVYFGKLKQVNRDYFSLKNVFYIQANGDEDEQSKNPQETSDQQSNIQLIKLGSEVHGPDDEMIISKDQVLFFENLKSDGKVSTSISRYNTPQ